MQEDLNKLIDQHLPNLVGDALKKKLAQADIDAKELIRQKEVNAGLERQIADYRTKEGKYATIETREREVAVKEQKLTIDLAVLAVRQDMTQQRLADHKELVLSVFANSKYKYMEFGSMPVPVDGGPHGCGHVGSGPYDKHIEVENGQ